MKRHLLGLAAALALAGSASAQVISGGGPVYNTGADNGLLGSTVAPASSRVTLTGGATYSNGVITFGSGTSTAVIDTQGYGSLSIATGSGAALSISAGETTAGNFFGTLVSYTNNTGGILGNQIGGNAQAVTNATGRFIQISSSGSQTATVSLHTTVYPGGAIYVGGGLISQQPQNSTSNSITPSVQYATTAYAFKASAGNLYGWDLTEGSTAAFFAFLNLAAAPSSGAAITPLKCVPVAANGYVGRPNTDIPERYTTGITVVSTSSCTTYTPVTPVQMSVNYE